MEVKMKQKLVLFLVLISFAGLFADGTEPEGSGTQTDPYQIEILDNLLWVSTNDSTWNAHFIQIADIDASDTQNWNNGEGFSPIGIYSDNPFTGSYNGEEHIINNLHIVLPDHDCVGFFGFTEESSISNLGLENIDVTGNQGVGGFVGWNDDSIISNCYTTGCIIGDQEIGGLVGYNHYSTISNSYNTGSVTGDNLVGGIVGFNNDASTISNCYSISSLTGNDEIGGLTGCNEYSTILNSYSTCSITGYNCVGGLVGVCYESSISNSYSNGSVIEGNNKVGGLVGINISCPIINSYSTSCVVGNDNVGGLIGYIDYPDVQNSFWDIQTSGQTTSAGGTGKTTAEMQDVATYTSLATVGLEEPWDFVGNPFDDIGNEDYWDIDETTNNGYPFLANPAVNVEEPYIPNPSSLITNLNHYPNPFNPNTTIHYSILSDGNVELSIYNIKGQKVKQLLSDQLTAGEHSVVWDGKDERGNAVSSGIYLYRLETGNYSSTKKMLLMK